MNSEPKKMSALRKEVAKTNAILLWMLRRIDRLNDDAVESGTTLFCPEPDLTCRGDCTGCWLSAALKGVSREQA